jgi:uncharacterized membrane protein
MEQLTKAGRICFGIAIAGIGFQHIFYADFHPIILPPLHAWIPDVAFWAYLAGAALITAGIAIIFEKKARAVSLALGFVLLVILCSYYIPYEIIMDPHAKHLGVWANAGKELALSGGAYVIAQSFPAIHPDCPKKRFLIKLFGLPMRWGAVFFSITMITFGIDHLLYAKYIAPLVPVWIPYGIFWTYLTGVALLGAGIAIILRIQVKVIAILLGTMILLWVIMLHIPRAIARPWVDDGNEVTSTFSALAFSGIAFVIAGSSALRKKKVKIE